MSFAWTLPRRARLRLGAVIGRGVYRYWGHNRRRIAEAQLKEALTLPSTSSVTRMAEESYAQWGRALVDFVYPPPADHLLWADGAFEVLQRALQRKRGVLFYASHFGSWELLAVAAYRTGLSSAAIVRSPSNPYIAQWLRKRRKRYGLMPIERGHGGGGLLGALRRRAIIVTLIDQSTHLPSVEVPFFGKLAPTPIRPAMMAVHHDLAVVFGWVERDLTDPTTHYIHIKNVVLDGNGPSSVPERAFALTAQVTKMIEENVHRRPDLWVWFHDRWRSTSSLT